MPVPTPFHDRTQALCHSYQWKDWAGYYAVCRYDHSLDREYFAFRESAGLIDVTPLFKYEVYGREAAALLTRVMVKDISRLRVGRVTYCCWCDDDGKVVDDGTVTRLDEDYFRVTAADPTFGWLRRTGRRYDVTIEDSTQRIATLALQGPTSREILENCCEGEVGALKFFGALETRLGGLDVWITRTGYTGDLGYEIWTRSSHALLLWDAVMEAGRNYGITPAGLDALDMTRIEAGFILQGIDYFSSRNVILERRKSTPFEIGLGWTVQMDRPAFIGQEALIRAIQQGPSWTLVGLEVNWEHLEALYESYGMPPNLPAEASREPLPVYAEGKQVGQATSHTWSPLLKKSIALASVRPDSAEPGTALKIEHTAEFERHQVAARVVPIPFYNPEHKRKP